MISKRYFPWLFIFYFLLIIFLTGCTDDKSPTNAHEGIDPAIVGDWYYKEIISLRGRPPESFYGIRILEDGIIWHLAIEFATGMLKEKPYPELGTFIMANNGIFILKINPIGMMLGGIYSSTYNVSAEELIFDTKTENGLIPFLNDKYTRSRVGNVVTEPVQANLEVSIGDSLFSNADISSIPSAYASFYIDENDSLFTLTSFSQDRQHINFRLENFQDIGTYGLGNETTGSASYYVESGCCIAVITTDQHPYAGSISFETFDLINKTCSGTFDFEIEQITFTNGHFQVPIYQ